MAFPLDMVDPSMFHYPSTYEFYGNGTQSLFLGNLTTSDQTIFNSSTANATTEKNRQMGKMVRFSIDMTMPNSSLYRMTGWKVLSPPSGLGSG